MSDVAADRERPKPDAAQESVEESFHAFVQSHRDRALRLAWRLVGGDAAAAEDVTQEAFLRAHRALPRFRGDAKLETWFYRILVREASRHRRWRRVRDLWTETTADDPPDPRAREPGDPPLRRLIGDALGSLPRGQREAFLLVHVEQFSVRETAEILGKAEGTVKSHVHRAMRALRVSLKELNPVPEGVEG